MTIAARTVDNGSGVDYSVLVDNITVDSQAGDAQVMSGAESIDDPIVGRPVLIAGRASTATPTAMSADGDVQALWLNLNGAVRTDPAGVASVTDVSQASAATSATLLTANTARRGLMLANTDANRVYLRYSASAASATVFSTYIESGERWEMPRPIYTGAITCIWAADGSGSLIGAES